MARKINIMLMLVLGVTISWGGGMFDISAPAKVDYRNIVEQFAPVLSKPYSITDIREVMLLQPIDKSPLTYRGLLAAGILKLDHNAAGPEFGVNTEPPKKSKSSEPEKQYAWYTEDRLFSEKEGPNDGKDMGIYTNPGRSRKPGTYAKLVNSIVRSLGSSIHMVGVHYRIVSGAR